MKLFRTIRRFLSKYWELIKCPFKSKAAVKIMASIGLGALWLRKALLNPTSWIVETLAISSISSILNRKLKLRDDSILADVGNALIGTLLVVGAVIMFNTVRELSIIFAVILIPIIIHEIDKKYTKYCLRY